MDTTPAQENRSSVVFVGLIIVSLGVGYFFGNMLNKGSLLGTSPKTTTGDSPLLSEKIARIPSATIVSITPQQVTVQDTQGKLVAFLITANAVFIDRTKNPITANVSSDLSAVKPGMKLQLMLEASAINPQFRVSQFILPKDTPQNLHQLLQDNLGFAIIDTLVYKDLAKLSSFTINQINVAGKLISLTDKEATIQSMASSSAQFTFPLVPQVRVRKFDNTSKTETSSNDVHSVPIGQRVGIGLSAFLNGGNNSTGTHQIVEFYYSVGPGPQRTY